MKLEKKNSTTFLTKNMILLNNKLLKKTALIKNQIVCLISKNGKNNSGKITVKYKGGGNKKKYRKINFKNTPISFGLTCSVEYDPFRNSNIASIFNLHTNTFCYIIAPKNWKIGDILQAGPNAKPKLGCRLPLKKIPVGSFIYNVSTKQHTQAQISRSAGTFSCLKEKSLTTAKIELNSKVEKKISSNCYATIGIVSNELIFLTKLGKAGRSRWLNKRPHVRGVAKNPVDHPNGGGEGKKSGKKKTPWG